MEPTKSLESHRLAQNRLPLSLTKRSIWRRPVRSFNAAFELNLKAKHGSPSSQFRHGVYWAFAFPKTPALTTFKYTSIREAGDLFVRRTPYSLTQITTSPHKDVN